MDRDKTNEEKVGTPVLRRPRGARTILTHPVYFSEAGLSRVRLGTGIFIFSFTSIYFRFTVFQRDTVLASLHSL